MCVPLPPTTNTLIQNKLQLSKICFGWLQLYFKHTNSHQSLGSWIEISSWPDLTHILFSYFVPHLIFWFICTSVFVIKHSSERPRWPLMLVFPHAGSLRYCQQQTFFAEDDLDKPSLTLIWPPNSHSLGFTRGYMWLLSSDPDRTRGCYTQEKEEGGVALSARSSLRQSSGLDWNWWQTHSPSFSHGGFSQHQHSRLRLTCLDGTANFHWGGQSRDLV